MYIFFKVLITSLVIVLISEAGKKYSTVGALLASLPLTSLLAFIWLYIETKDEKAISNLSWEIFYMVIPSLLFFVSLPLLLKHYKFIPSLLVSIVNTAFAFFIWMMFVKKIGLLN